MIGMKNRASASISQLPPQRAAMDHGAQAAQDAADAEMMGISGDLAKELGMWTSSASVAGRLLRQQGSGWCEAQGMKPEALAQAGAARPAAAQFQPCSGAPFR